MKNGTKRSKRERGFTLLEYCAGAAVIIAVIWVGFRSMGDEIKNYLEGIGAWAKQRSSQISNSEGTK